MNDKFIKMTILTRFRRNVGPIYYVSKVNLKRILISAILVTHLQIQANIKEFEPITQLLAHSLSNAVTHEYAEGLSSEEESILIIEDAHMKRAKNTEITDTEQVHDLDTEMTELANRENLLIEENIGEGNERLLEQDTRQEKNRVHADDITDNYYLIESGVNFLLPIAVNHLNRIETPFLQPEIKTSSEAVIEIEGNVLYVLVNHNEPVSLFITESNQPYQAISLTLIAKRIPPRTVTLEMANLDNTNHKQWRTFPKEAKSKDYISNLKTILSAIAKHELPSGYTQRRTQLTQDLVTCHQVGIDHGLSDAITLIGEELIIYITKVTNRSQEIISLNEASCHGQLITAISFFPHQKLSQGQSTEMFLVRNRVDSNFINQIDSNQANGFESTDD